VVEILTMLAEQGETATLRYIRQVVLKHPVKYYKNLPPKEVPPETKDPTFLSGAEIQGLDLPTPYYLYDEETIVKNCAILRQAFAWNPGYRQFFPVKATPTPAILRLLRRQGQGVVCSSAAELELVRRCGFQADEILFMPNYPTDEDLDKAAQLQCQVILDGPDLVEPMAQRGLLRDTVGLRLNPGGVFRFGENEVRLEGIKFGLTPEAAKDCISQLQAKGVSAVGIHSYLAGNTLSPDYYPAAAKLLLDAAAGLSQQTGIRIAYINISGGLGIPYEPGDQPLDLCAIGEQVRQVFAASALGSIPVYTEVGRYLTGPAGLLVTRVTHVRKCFRNFAGVDASAANLMRPMMYGSYHHISVAGKEGKQDRKLWDVVGTVCENSDKFAEKRPLPELEVGDLAVIHDVGAHGHSMGYQYGGRLRCGEYLRSADGTVTMIRRPETAEDYLQTAIF
jgi:diaminopimelate decarboxylase